MPRIIRKNDSSSLVETQHSAMHAVGWPHVHVRSNLWNPPTDMYEIEGAYVVRVEIAGMREDDFSVSIENNYLVISGDRPDTPERRAYHQMEIRFGRFATSVGLPGNVDTDKASAEYKDGMLVVTLPKARSNHIEIDS
jgi:HSP20 family protein